MRSLAVAYANSLVGTYYRRLVHGEAIPASGGLLLYTNHVNGLIDAELPLGLTERRQFFLAKPSLFRMPLLGSIVRSIGAIPIYRKKDGADMSKNEDAFREIFRVLRSGGMISLYPEGESLPGFKTRPFKTGAARMVLGAQEKCEDPIRLVPVALLYEEQESFSSRVHIWVGKAFDLMEHMGAYERDPRETVRVVTDMLQDRMDELTVPVDTKEEFQNVLRMDRILSDSAQGSPPRLRRLALQWQEFAAQQPERARDLSARVQALDDKLIPLGIEARDLVESGLDRTPGHRFLSALKIDFILLMTPILVPPIALAAFVAHHGRSTPDKLVTVRALGASVLVPLWGIVLAYWLSSKTALFPHFWPNLVGIWFLTVVAAGVASTWSKPRALRRALTGIGILGREKDLRDLWLRKRALQSELQVLFPD
ncbi:MAG: 1-acyl-sn-glycerol-3-phosphate acyltransferase [Planctomycetes bacterium]|nr:1-acyl-sn-glycerol-3-phosphate acyltransferase [Planctomycetota bacterium]